MKNIEGIRWGILGCGDVCEIKSGPAFNKISHSKLIAVMRRDAAKAEDFARRHGVPKYYSDAEELIHDPEVNAIYIATPPKYHEDYAIACMKAGKPVYIEKPVAMDSASSERIMESSRRLNIKSCVAHYRRGLPVFRKIKELVHSGVIGKATLIVARTLVDATEKTGTPGYWRIDPEFSGGGLFFDLAPHQLDIFYWIFGQPSNIRGYSMNQTNAYAAPDLTTVDALFGQTYLHAIWAFNVGKSAENEVCEIIGDRGKIRFSFFNPSDITVTTPAGTETITLPYPENIQQPMIADVVQYFLGDGPNPCSVEDALVTMRVMDAAK